MQVVLRLQIRAQRRNCVLQFALRQCRFRMPRAQRDCSDAEIGKPHIGESGPVDLVAAMTELRERGYAAILTEGGPHVMGNLMSHHLLDEAFVTISPVVAGRNGEPRLGMVAGVELLPGHGLWTKLLSARRHGDFLFLRYGLKNR